MSVTATSKRRMRLDTTAIVYIALIGVIALGSVLVSVAGRNFFSDGNIRDILTGMSVLGFVAVGQTLVILIGSLDLSVPYVISLSSLLAAETMRGNPNNILTAVVLALSVSALIGLVNGLIVTGLKVHGFIATLGVGLIVKGYLDMISVIEDYPGVRVNFNLTPVLMLKIKELNENEDIDGFIVQLPLPKQIDTQKVLMAVDPGKDVDGFHPENFGKMALDMSTFIPATPFGILELLQRYDVDTKGKHTVVIGRSHIVGRPMSILMSRRGWPGNSTVTLTHSNTKNIAQITTQADIIISALGVPNFLKAEMVKDDAVIIDVGITRVEDPNHPKGYVITGDVDFENVSKKASFITPVPGGVGPMTIAMLLKNTLLAREQRSGN